MSDIEQSADQAAETIGEANTFFDFIMKIVLGLLIFGLIGWIIGIANQVPGVDTDYGDVVEGGAKAIEAIGEAIVAGVGEGV